MSRTGLTPARVRRAAAKKPLSKEDVFATKLVPFLEKRMNEAQKLDRMSISLTKSHIKIASCGVFDLHDSRSRNFLIRHLALDEYKVEFRENHNVIIISWNL